MHNPGLPTEWNISDQIRRETSHLPQRHEVDAARRDVGRLEHSLWEARAEIDGLRAQLQTSAEGISQLTDVVNGLLDRVIELERAAKLNTER